MEKRITTHLKRCSPVKMTNALVNLKKNRSLPLVGLVSLEASLEAETKKGLFRLNHWRFSRKAKCLTVAAIAAILLLSFFAFFPKQNVSRGNIIPQNGDNSTATPLPTANNGNNSSISNDSQGIDGLVSGEEPSSSLAGPPGLIASAQTINSTVWLKVAANAWAYFLPGVGVDSNTGLPFAGGTNFEAFTDWDLGVYIQSVIDAQELGLISTGSAWGSSARINDVLTFLENRPLNATNGNYPFQFYDATTGGDAWSLTQENTVDISDTGRLFVALNNLINFNSSLRQPIDNLVYNVNQNRSNYAALVPGIKNDILTSNSIYAYYIDSGFASFWSLPNTSIILNNMYSDGTVTTYGVSLPLGQISCTPLLCSVFELNNSNPQLMSLMNQVYLAHEAYYNATGQYVAFGEGNDFNTTAYLDEWVVLPNGDRWKILEDGTNTYLNVNPVIYNNVAYSFLALYHTTFARDMVVYLEQLLPDSSNGYADGADNYGNVVTMVGSNTNGLILDAALYYIQNNP